MTKKLTRKSFLTIAGMYVLTAVAVVLIFFAAAWALSVFEMDVSKDSEPESEIRIVKEVTLENGSVLITFDLKQPNGNALRCVQEENRFEADSSPSCNWEAFNKLAVKQ